MLLVQRYQPRSNRETHETRHIVNAESLHQLCSMCLNCLDTNSQNLSDVLGAVALRNQLQNLPLARSQTLDGGLVAIQTTPSFCVRRNCWREVLLAARDGFYRVL